LFKPNNTFSLFLTYLHYAPHTNFTCWLNISSWCILLERSMWPPKYVHVILYCVFPKTILFIHSLIRESGISLGTIFQNINWLRNRLIYFAVSKCCALFITDVFTVANISGIISCFHCVQVQFERVIVLL